MKPEARREPRGFMSGRIQILAVLLVAELVAAVFLFQVFSDFECRQTSIEFACRGLRSAVIRGFCVFVALGLFLWVRTDLRQLVLERTGRGGRRAGWAALHLAGVALIFVPWLLADQSRLDEAFPLLFGTLSVGGLMAAAGALMWLMPARDWRDVLRAGQGALLVIVAVAAVIPDLAAVLGYAWAIDFLVKTAFYGVAFVLGVTGNEVLISYTPRMIGIDEFIVEIADSCSGVEGFALVTGFMAIYAVLMRGMIRPGRYWLVVWPLALLASWTFNIIRIATLIMIGAWISPDLAENGFHSFAGWFFFAIIALGILLVVQASSWILREEVVEGAAAADIAPLTEDWAAARIVPFILFMLTGMAVNAFMLYPELGYPFQMVVMAVAIWVFRRGLFRFGAAGIDPFAIAAGAVIGVGWVVTAQPNAEILAGIGTLGTTAFVLWAIFRVFGTIVIVPIVEEAFFRGYLLTRLDIGGPLARAIAVVVSSLAFALLHGRIVEAGLAGLLFAWVTLRRGELKDAIVSHMVANAIVAAAALIAGDWSLI